MSLCYNSICVRSLVSDRILCRVDNNLFPRSERRYLIPAWGSEKKYNFFLKLILQKCSSYSQIHQFLLQFISLWKYEMKNISVCLFWTQHTPRLTTALGGGTGWWNKLIFVQQRTFITHSNDDIFPFSYKIESRSLSHIYVFPPPDWWRDQFKFSTFTKYTDVCSASFSLSKKGSLFRNFNELNRVITILGARCGFYQYFGSQWILTRWIFLAQ